MKINELIVAMNSLQWDIETFKNLKDRDINYYAEAIENVQELLLNLDRQLKTSRNDGQEDENSKIVLQPARAKGYIKVTSEETEKV